MKSKKLAYHIILILFCIVLVSVLMTGCDGDKPIVLDFSASPSTINQGESSTLAWDVSKAGTVTITPGVGTVASSGSTSVSPGVTTTYTLTATNSSGSNTASFTVNVGPALLPVHNLTQDTYYNTIQAALNDADSDNTIEVTDGTYDETINFPSGKKVILQSVNGPSSTTIRGDDNSYTVNLEGSLSGTTIEGFTITHAVDLSGRGIVNDWDSKLNVYNCIISGNSASSGGGIYNAGTLKITDASTISGNNAVNGGGICNYVDCTLTITGASTISGNTAAYNGGGIFNDGILTITDASTVSGNTAGYGGGIYTGGGNSTIQDNTIKDNEADFGGGICVQKGSQIISGNTITGNTAAQYGGGICVYGNSPIIKGNDIMGNTAGSGGGIFVDGGCLPTIGGTSPADTGNFNTICGNSPDQIAPDNYPNNYITTFCMIELNFQIKQVVFFMLSKEYNPILCECRLKDFIILVETRSFGNIKQKSQDYP